MNEPAEGFLVDLWQRAGVPRKRGPFLAGLRGRVLGGYLRGVRVGFLLLLLCL